MWHTSFKVYYFNLRPLCLKLMQFGVCTVAQGLLYYYTRVCANSRVSVVKPWFAWLCAFTFFVLLQELPSWMDSWRCSKMEVWLLVIETISKTSGKKPKNKKQNQSSPTTEKEITLWQLLGSTGKQTKFQCTFPEPLDVFVGRLQSLRLQSVNVLLKFP